MSAHDSRPIRRSIEVEYWVIDEAGRLVEPGDLVSASPGAEREFVRPLLEIKTTPCTSTAELRRELYQRLQDVLAVANDCGKRLVPLATPLTCEDIAELPTDRTRIQNAVIGEDFQYVRHCAGTHIHVEQQPGHEVAQLNTFIALDPALALVNSAAHFDGEPLAAGARSELYRRKAYAGTPHQGRLWPYVDSRNEWTRRLERRYEDFVTAALEAGVDRATVEANFDPESAIWTPVQFRDEFGTVEWRSPDTALPSQVVRLADRLATTVGYLHDGAVQIEGDTGRVHEDGIVLPTFDTVLNHVDAAIRDGVADDALRAYLDRMGFDVSTYDPLTHESQSAGPLTTEEARRRRLEYADRLERDIQRTEPLDAD